MIGAGFRECGRGQKIGSGLPAGRRVGRSLYSLRTHNHFHPPHVQPNGELSRSVVGWSSTLQPGRFPAARHLPNVGCSPISGSFGCPTENLFMYTVHLRAGGRAALIWLQKRPTVRSFAVPQFMKRWAGGRPRRTNDRLTSHGRKEEDKHGRQQLAVKRPPFMIPGRGMRTSLDIVSGSKFGINQL